MNKIRQRAGFVIIPIMLFALGLPSVGDAIKKCQDASGKWHYGDFADAACAKSVVSELDADTGIKVGEDAPPPSKAELDAQKAADNAAKQAAEQRLQDEEIMEIYSSEEMIVQTRDRKLDAIDKNLEITRKIRDGIAKDLETLHSRKQTNKVKQQIAERDGAITSYDAVINQDELERKRLEAQYNDILQRFQAAALRLKAEGKNTPSQVQAQSQTQGQSQGQAEQ